jgi:hypothetical protein
VSPSGAHPANHEQQRWRRATAWRHHILFWPVTASALYLVCTLAVTAAKYFSEMSKLSRGFYSDTFSPYFYTHILTFPTSSVLPDWHGYPDVSETQWFDATQWKESVRDAVGPVIRNVLIHAVLIAAVVLFYAARSRRAQK